MFEYVLCCMFTCIVEKQWLVTNVMYWLEPVHIEREISVELRSSYTVLTSSIQL